jgi:cytochrome c
MDPQTGYLFLALGDNTSPYGESDSFAPLDQRENRENFDAQRTAANTMDLRGKILRILPKPDGTYEIPSTNLFANQAHVGRPEIFVMGVRNPFRFNVDIATGTLFWAEVGPNSVPDPKRGPLGVDEVNRARQAGNFGWPYCIGPNWSYRNWDYATKTSTRNFDCNRPENTSPHLDKNGARYLPPSQPAILYYGYPPSEEFPQIHQGITSPSKPGRCALLGPYIRSNNTHDGSSLLPEYFDNTMMFLEWRREFIMEMKMNEAGDIHVINPLWSSYEWWGPIDMKVARDGWIYVAEYGTDFEGLVRPARITRIRYTTQPKVPICEIKADKTSGIAPLTVQFSAADSKDQGNSSTSRNLKFRVSLCD